MRIVDGCGMLTQPVLFTGKGRIFISKDVQLGYRPSPFLYNGYIHIEARRPASVISIGNDVRINNNCVLVSEGEGSEIGNGAVVVSSIPANSIAAGNPARVIRQCP